MNEGPEGIAIIGMSGRFPGAPSIEALWEALREGRETIHRFTDEELEAEQYDPAEVRGRPNYVRARGILSDVELFDAAFFGMNPREAAVTDPQHRLWLECSWEAMERAGYAPGTIRGAVGVFAGTLMSTYLLNNLLSERDPLILLSNDKDHLATRTAFKFDLRGPAVTVQTACSTSLVAVVQACQSLLQYETEMCIAGGVSVTFPQARGYLFLDGAITSPDGHCRPFDARAQGTVPAHGVAAVVLKRLEDAVRDGDHIHAVIRGSAINNDGAAKISYTAPSVEGQAEVIALAQALADVHPDTIGYVEAHGTATPLGDPIEVAGLTKAFRQKTARKQFCALGSVKGNLGHLDSAAGAAGLIKAALVLERELVPRSLHYEAPNPEIDLENSPFFVVREPTPWPRGAEPRRAGVSSFGIGGTNAHAVLEEAPSRPPSGPSRPGQLLTLSARTSTALDAATGNLARYLRENPDVPLADVAYTLALGRADFGHRRFVVAHDVDDAVTTLTGDDRSRLDSSEASKTRREVVFMFPGQGAQHVNMGRALYETEPVFRLHVDAGADALIPLLGQDIRHLLYPPAGSEEQAAEGLKQTAVTQPVLFVVQYALARLWESWGVVPETMIGHSVGEYTAACLAGVFSFEDTVKLLATRGRMMQDRPAGGMLAVRLPAAELVGMIAEPLALAASNAPALTVVSGPADALDVFRRELEDGGGRASPLHTSHAYHSPMMDEVLAPYTEFVAGVERNPPTRRWISGLTGEPITAGMATDPEYWARQLRGTVQFSAGVTELLRTPGRIFLEVGPGTTLSTFALQHPEGDSHRTVIASLGHARDDGSALDALLDAAGRLWAAGGTIDWNGFFGEEERRRVILPTYPFERKRHWVDPPVRRAAPTTGVYEERMAETDVVIAEGPAPQAAGASGAAHLERILGQVLGILGELWGEDLPASQVDRAFVEVGFDSLLLTQASAKLQAEFGIPIKFRQMLEELSTPRSIAEYLAERLPDETLKPAAHMTLPAPSRAVEGSHMSASGIIQFPSGDLGAVDRIVAGQLEIMRQQLEVLRLHGRADAAGDVEDVVGEVAHATARAKPAALGAPHAGAEPVTERETESASPSAKAFGAAARVELGAVGELTPTQRDWLDGFMARYVARTASSRQFTERHRPSLADPRAVAGFMPLHKDIVYPIVVERAEGSRVWDLDGNEYIDMINGFGSVFLGHRAPVVVDAVSRCLEQGFAIGPQHPLAGEVAELMREITGHPRTALCNTGSEAVLAAIRMARTVTGRSTIVVFRDSYHGIFDEVVVRVGRSGKSLPASPGIPATAVEEILVLDYGEEESLRTIEQRIGSIAAVLVEPVQSRHLALQPRDFLHRLRDITKNGDAALVFDEMITGFRVGLRGAQGYFGVEADIATYGKVVGGGLPIGLVSGSPRFLDALDGGPWVYGDDSFPAVGMTYFAGTFVRHPLALAAVKATLTHLRDEGDALPTRVTALAEQCVERLQAVCRELGAPIGFQRFSSAFRVHFTVPVPVGGVFLALLRERGIHIFEGRTWFFTAAHTSADVDFVVDAFRGALTELLDVGLLPREQGGNGSRPGGNGDRPGAAVLRGGLGAPPYPDARLGRGPDGNPGWFRPDPDRPGKYVRVEG